MTELKVEVDNFITPKNCSKLVIHLIKYILYQSNQIPFNYESLTKVIKTGKMYYDSIGEENEVKLLTSYKDIVAYNFYKKILTAYENCENTFKSIELELMEPNNIQEITVVIGTTLLLPRKIYRIQIPLLCYKCCDETPSEFKNLSCLGSHLLTSEDLHNYSKDHIEPTNNYILLKKVLGNKTSSKWYLPNESYRIPNKVMQMLIKLEQPKIGGCLCIKDTVNLSSNGLSDTFGNLVIEDNGADHLDGPVITETGFFSWYQPKETLKGFKDQKVGDSSAFNLFFSSKSSRSLKLLPPKHIQINKTN